MASSTQTVPAPIAAPSVGAFMPALSLWWREIVRFYRQRSRVVGVIASPVLFWIVIGSGFGTSFKGGSGAGNQHYLDYFFPGAKIGVLGLNGSGQSTLLRIMAGEDTNFEGEVIPMPNMKIGFLPQEPRLDPEKTVRDAVEEGLGETLGAKKRLDEIYAAYAEPDADFDKLAAEQAKLEAIVNAAHSDSADLQMEVAADALRLPPWDAKIGPL